ncbi:NAD-dependent DNA ligase LigA [Texas Phoenix palm phytoplasma]|uniref:DNA ligase n=1 Tax=Texas Phoenix palm phytoplasma TaxID=176709 RepID=A0ABS5BI07_9MOLU|nr:NAD-dependent DNA ligase LigA [Texas Phoenix palm phytoplasma]MBP3059211.1 NAD-dependent DNA ligase LigA [Texas Phoenix palm phytoplasma]
MSLDIKKKIKFLTEKLNEANYEYYHLNQTSLTDEKYDSLLRELIILEKKYPQYKLQNSPTSKIGGFISYKFKKIFHEKPMLSLDNVFDKKELKEFFKRISKKIVNFKFITELKIDGVAISLKYEKGILVYAATRGNGIEGELITDNIKTIKDIPLKLNQPIDLLVRGEIFFDHENFEKLNNFQKNNKKNLFSNARNAASGTLRQLDSKIVSKRNLSSFFYSIVEPPLFIRTQEEVLIFLNKMGFNVNNNYYVVNNFDDLIFTIDKYKQLLKELPYNVDGVVIKVNELKFYPVLGSTSKFPRWSVAYKFNSDISETIIKKIFFQVGRTGSITPIGHLVPVIVSGSLISKVSLHNYSYIEKKDIRENDFVLIHKSGSVIPEIISVIKEKRTNQKRFEMITNCPSCNSFLIKKDDYNVDYFCCNDECEEKKIKKIIHFASKEALDIDFLGEKNLIFLFKKGFVRKISDLYKLKEFVSQIEKLHNFGNKKINNIIISIENSKYKSFDRILFGLGIENIGIKIAKLLVTKFKNIDNIISSSIREILEIPSVGDKIATSIYEYFKNTKNLQEINLLKKYNINFSSKENKKDHFIYNNFFYKKKIVLTGVFSNYSRKEVIKILEKNNAYILKSVSSKIDYLIYGKNFGSNFQKAVDLSIPILNEKEFFTILDNQ